MDTCETAGHKFEKRYNLVYSMPQSGAHDIGIDFPIIMVILSCIGAVIGMCMTAKYTHWWPMIAVFINLQTKPLERFCKSMMQIYT